MAVKILMSSHKFSKNADGSYKVEDKFRVPKITGTSLGSVVGCKSAFGTPFSIACRMLGLYGEDISNVPAVKAGVALEPIILDYVKDYDVIPADKVYADRRGPHDGWKQDFDDDIFGGHVDGVTAEGDIVEVKTTSSPESWLNGVPEHYWLQASLYAHFMGASKIMFVVGIVDDKARADPSSWSPEGNVSVIWTALHPDLENILNQARDYYHTYLENGVTPIPDMSNPLDRKIVDTLDAQLMADNDISKIVVAYEECLDLLDTMADVEKRAEELKSQINTYLESHKQESISGDKYTFKRTVSARKSVDTEALKRDGLYEDYLKTVETVSIRKTKKK